VGEKQAATVGGGTATDVRPLVWTEFLSTDWAQQNSDFDGDRFASIEALYADADPMLAMVSGTYSGHRILDSVECSGGDCATFEQNWQIGVPAERSYSFDIECDDLGFPPCTGVALTESQDLFTGQIREDRVELAFDGSSYMWQKTDQGSVCENRDGFTEGFYENSVIWTIVPEAAEFIDGQFVVTELSGTATARLVTLEPVYSAECAQFQTDFTEIGTLSVTLDR
ncbi:MAG TPA: hypothetical protein PK890_08135, partial [Terrimesophilobacter sp.]|nr:hypothetical protein [Terrimesophilobacter sp.]